jgi:acetyl esterase/lipase
MRPELSPEIPYHPDPALAGHPRLRLDLYRPANAGGLSPAIIWFHGGGLETGSKDGDGAWAERLSEHGYGLVTANYRYLGPDAPYPTYIRDAAHAVAWTQRNAVDYGLDSARLFIGGASAGAYLTAMLAMDPRHLAESGADPATLRGAILLSAQLTTHFNVRVQRGASKDAIVSDEASPLYFARRETMPLLLLTGDADIAARREENALFTAVLKSLGHRDIAFHVVSDRDHGGVCNRIGEPGDPAAALILDFIRRAGG